MDASWIERCGAAGQMTQAGTVCLRRRHPPSSPLREALAGGSAPWRAAVWHGIAGKVSGVWCAGGLTCVRVRGGRMRAELWPRAWAVARGRRSDRCGRRRDGCRIAVAPTSVAEAEEEDGGGTSERAVARLLLREQGGTVGSARGMIAAVAEPDPSSPGFTFQFSPRAGRVNLLR